MDRYDYGYDPQGQGWAARLLRQVGPGSTVLELGPGPGAMTKVLVERGHAVTVIENDPEAVAMLQGFGVDVIAADLDGDDWINKLQGRCFDVVLACDVLEHLRAPECVLRSLHGLMAPGGRLILSIPNVSYAGVVGALRLGIFDYTEKGLLDRTHLRFFTRRSIEKILLEYGWAPRYWNANRIPIEQSEFVWCWRTLAEDQRRNLMEGWLDFDVYQWMTVATPISEAAAWEVNQARDEAMLVRQELHELLVRYQGEHGSLLEHQKAFGEAKEVIARMQAEIAGLETERESSALKLEGQEQRLAKLFAEKEELVAQLLLSRERSWLARVWRRLTRD
ncbi:methyltransferase domain-containing protein [Ottowia testudinis]|nr:methyltransferase domain-containing protein [Ottowia testudinis]